MHPTPHEQSPMPMAEQLMLLPPSEDERTAPKPDATAAVAKSPHARRYKRGKDSAQPMLLPPSTEDYVAANNPVRAIKAYVDTLDIEALQFNHAGGGLTAGQPAFDPADLLELYLYGYLNRVRSSRRLEAECLRNLEVIWLLNGLRPGYHTIADFRKNNAEALKAVNRDFVQLCRELGLFGGKLVGIDGSFFNGNASHASVKTKKQLEAELAATERDIERYQRELERNDSAEADLPDDATASAERLAALKARARNKTEQLEQLENNAQTQLSRTDPDARRLTKNGKKVTGYNVQSVVDDEHKLILTHEVTNAGNDFGQLAPMAEQAERTLAEGTQHEQAPCSGEASEQTLEVVADAGYYTEADIATCEAKSISVYVPVPDKHRAVTAGGRLPGSDFHYDADQDVYICPANKNLSPCGRPSAKRGVLRQRYQSDKKQCATCPRRTACLPKKMPMRQIYRSEHAAALERHRRRMSDAGEKMRQRAALCEHPFGTMKRWLGWDHFLVRGFKKVRGEMALLVNCYNFRRLLSIFGVEGFIALCEARRQARDDSETLFGLLAVPFRRLRGFYRWLRRAVRFFPELEYIPLATRLTLASAL